MEKILVLDFCNYIDYKMGGGLSFAKNLISAFGDDLTLVGITTDKNDPVGRWFKKRINGLTLDYFALARYNSLKTKYLIPDRLVCFLLFRYYKKKILSIPFKNVFVQRQEILLAIRDFKYQNICYNFPGLENPLKISKYWYGKYLAKEFDKVFFNCFKSVKLILAAGDDRAIEEMRVRSKGTILKSSLIKFPVRINTNIFSPLDKSEVREKLNISKTDFIVITTGRLGWFKGWQFMIDCYVWFERSVPSCLFYIVGEGEDLQKIKKYILQKNISEKVILAGPKNPVQISLLLNASDLFIMGSYKEGWSTSLSEAIACGIPSCVTNFSSATEIIQEGKNGYVIMEHNNDLFVQGMLKAMKIPRPVYNENVRVFSTNRLKDDLLNIWKLM
jgi:glycosyltransferase involved in cell wall biosynthesis